MIWLCLEGVAETPIALPQRSEAGNLYESLPEVPGTAVRGAFAGKYIRRRGWSDGVPENEAGEKFERWFENSKTRFGPLRPVPPEWLLFSIGVDFQGDFDKSKISEALRQTFEQNETSLSQDVIVSVEKKESKWLIIDKGQKETYSVTKYGDKLKVCFEPFYSAPVLPVPRSARSCKYEPGFADADKHSVFDSLLFQARADDEQFGEKMRKCPCGAPIEPLESTWMLANWDKAWGLDYDPIFRLNTHVGIGPAVGEDANLSDEGRLFSLQHFPAETRFRGWLAIGDGTSEEALEALGFAGLGKSHAVTLRVGRRSRSYGALKVWVTEPITQPPWERSYGSLTSRFDKFQEEAKNHILSIPEYFGEDFAVFSVTCLTDLILLDDFLRPCRAITAFQIARRLGLDWCESQPVAEVAKTSVWRVGALTGTRQISGWNAAHRLPKENESAIVAGSVFLFAVRNGTVEKLTLLEKLADLENNGIGWRRSEGFGQVLVCDEFHLQAEGKDLQRPAVRLKAPSVKPPSEPKKSPYPLDGAVVNFFEQNRSLLFPNNQSALTKTQINSLRDRVQRYDRVTKSPKVRLKEYLQHKADLDRTKQPLMQALIELFKLEGKLEWEYVRRRVDDFVRALLLSVESPDLEIDELVSIINESGKEESK